jgi:hypothetical protein
MCLGALLSLSRRPGKGWKRGLCEWVEAGARPSPLPLPPSTGERGCGAFYFACEGDLTDGYAPAVAPRLRGIATDLPVFGSISETHSV